MTTIEKARLWLSESFDEETRAKVQQLIDENGAELEDSFYKELEFGTGGMRGVMGVGTNRLNIRLGRLPKGWQTTCTSSLKAKLSRLLSPMM